MDDALLDGITIPDEVLDQIAGGVMTDTVRKVLDMVLTELKQQGATKERALEIFGLTEDPQLRADTLAYISDVWESI